MKKLLIGSVSILLAVLPLMGASAVSQTPIAPFSGAGATGVTASSWFDYGQTVSAGVQIWCSSSCTGTTVNVEIRSTGGPPVPAAYIAAQCVDPPATGTSSNKCFYTLPIGKDFRLNMTVQAGGPVYAIFNSRT